MKQFLERINSILVVDETRIQFQFKAITTAFALVACGMTVLNVFTHNYVLGSVTLAFFLICVICYFLADKGTPKAFRCGMILFSVGIEAMMTYFIITGGVDNFSILWVLLLPALGILFFGFNQGSVICGTMFIIMLLCFHVPPFANITTDYGSTFRTRFPIIYISSYIISVIIEYIRTVAVKEVEKTRNQYKFQYSHDALTGLKNRYGLQQSIESLEKEHSTVALAMLDIDFFKSVNDRFGHDQGDIILYQIAYIAGHELPENAEAFRWGGEEFALLFKDVDDAAKYCQDIINEVRHRDFMLNEQLVHITVSIGLAVSEVPSDQTDFKMLLVQADDLLYRAKETGRDRLVTSQDK